MDSTEENHTQKLNGSNGSTESSPYAVFGEGVEQIIYDAQVTINTAVGAANEAIKRPTAHDKIQKEERVHSNHGLEDSRSFQTISGGSVDSVGTVNEAIKRPIVHGRIRKEERGHCNHGFDDSGSFQTIPEGSFDSVGTTNEAIKRPTVHGRIRKEERGHSNHGFEDHGSFQTVLEDSFDSTGDENDATHRIKAYLENWKNIIENSFLGFADSGPSQTMPGNRWISDEDEIEANNPNPVDTNHTNVERRDSDSKDSWTSYQEKTTFCKKKCLWFLVLMIVIVGISVGLAKFLNDKKIAGLNDTPTINIDDFPDKCENDVSTVTVGEQMCIPYTQKLTGSPSSIRVKQLSSQYVSALQGFLFNVSSDSFMQRNGNWIVNLNSSRPHQQLRFMMGKATCDSIGKYEISIEYDDGNVTSNKFEISLKDPQLQHSVTRINDNIHIHCEMIKTCMASSLVLFVNDGGSSRMIPNINVCSNNDQQSGTTVSVDAILGASWFSGNTTISCVPLITDSGLAANLTSTTRIPVCEGDCVPDCKDDPQGEAYFPDKNDCTQFYQCSNGQLVSQSCSPSTYWSTSECTCVHFDDEICNRDTNRFLSPLLSIEKCTNASLV